MKNLLSLQHEDQQGSTTQCISTTPLYGLAFRSLLKIENDKTLVN